MKLTKIHKLVMGAPRGALTLTQLLQPLRKAFKPYPWIRFEQRTLENSEAEGFIDAIVVSGRFEPDYCDRSICFIRLSGYSKKSDKKIWFDGILRDRILFNVFATIAHERIHMLQSRKAKGCPRLYHIKHPDPIHKKAIEYYGSNIEIDAHAHSAALEEKLGIGSEVIEKYRAVFAPDDFRFKRFLKKKWQYSLTLPPLYDINRSNVIQTS